MKITSIKQRELQGTLKTDGEFWEDRLVRPLDVYPEHKNDVYRAGLQKTNANGYPIKAVFLEIHTDEGIVGVSGPIAPEIAYIIDEQFRWLLIGADPIASERLWDVMYRHAIHGRKGNTMLAISAIDCGLWDVRGKAANMPVHRLLGGPVRTTFPAYASMLGYSIEPSRAAERARQYAAMGYTAQKWFFRYGPTDGRQGIERNIALVRAVREAVGDDVDIMMDAWSSWDVPYSVMMCERMAEYDIAWLEEPVLADKIDSYAELRSRVDTPISGGEHEYTRWGFKALLEAEACDVYQADTYWAGGISEMVKIAALCSTYDKVLIPHGHSTPANAHFTAAMSPVLTPMIEYLVKWNEIHQHFLATPVKPVNGMITVSDAPGLGIEIDPAKVESERELKWG